MNKKSKYTTFRPHLKHHRELGGYIEEVLEETDKKELTTPELKDKLAEDKTEMEPSFVRSIISDGSDWFEENHDINLEARGEGSGGNPTFFWRLDG